MENLELIRQRIDKMNDEIILLSEKFEDHFLSDEERLLIDKTFSDKSKEKLIPESDVF